MAESLNQEYFNDLVSNQIRLERINLLTEEDQLDISILILGLIDVIRRNTFKASFPFRLKDQKSAIARESSDLLSKIHQQYLT